MASIDHRSWVVAGEHSQIVPAMPQPNVASNMVRQRGSLQPWWSHYTGMAGVPGVLCSRDASVCVSDRPDHFEGDVDDQDSSDGKPPSAPRVPRPTMQVQQDKAFEQWLKRGLHAMYDDVAREPLPAELLALIEAHRKKS